MEDKKPVLTTRFKAGQTVRFIRIKVGDDFDNHPEQRTHHDGTGTQKKDKFIEKLQFLNTACPIGEKLKKNDQRLVAEVKACHCGFDVDWEVPRGYNIVGFFGLTQDSANALSEGHLKNHDNIHGLGFITMHIAN